MAALPHPGPGNGLLSGGAFPHPGMGNGLAGFVPHPASGNGLLPPEHASLIARVIQGILGGFHGGHMGLAQAGDLFGGGSPHPAIHQIIHGFGPGGAVVGNPTPTGGLLPPAPGHPLSGPVPMPDLPAGTYTGAYAAQGLRTSDPTTAAQLWEHRHPYATSHGEVPHWVIEALTRAIHAQASAPPPVPTNQAQ